MRILNCNEKSFGGRLKIGDLIAVLNIFQVFRNNANDQNIKFYLPDSAIQPRDYVLKFKNFLNTKVDFFSETEGNENLLGSFEIWTYRHQVGEHVKIKNSSTIENKICVFPLIDAEYNTTRNWPDSVLKKIINEYSGNEFESHKKIIGIKNPKLLKGIDIKNFEVSSDLQTNLEHIMTCSHYVGGDTGLSHFASVLDDNKILNYYYYDGLHGTWDSNFTAPFYVKSGRGNIINYKYE